MQDQKKRNGMTKQWSMRLLLSCVCLLGNDCSNATQDYKLRENDPKKTKKNSLPSKDWNHEFTIALEQAHYNYREPDVYQHPIYNTYGARWVQTVGNFWGGYASYCLTWQDTLFVQPEIRILYGKHQYTRGQKGNILNKTKHAIPSLLYEPRLIVGGKLPSIYKVAVSPYTGLGYRFKSDDSEEVKTSRGHNLAFYRKSNYIYVPFGASADYSVNETWSLTVKGEYDWIVKAWQYSRMPTERATTFKQPNGYGLKGEATVSYLYQKVKFFVTPYVYYWNMRNSREKNEGAMEPYNITWETGLRLGVTF